MKTYSRKNSSYLKKAFIASNFNEMCRLCLSEVDTVLTPIIQDSKISLQEWIQYSVDVLVEEGDGLPPNVCEECLAMVEQYYMFKKKCKASDSKMREHLELLEINEECKLNEIGFNDTTEDHNSLFAKDQPDQIKCDESSAVDTGGTISQEICTEEEGKVEESDNKGAEKESIKSHDIFSQEIQNVLIKLEPEEKVVINKVKRFILKGEKKADDQEEDLTVCDIVPLEIPNEDLAPLDENETPDDVTYYTNLDYKDQNGHVSDNESGIDFTSEDKSDLRIQEIYQLWDNEEEVEEVQKDKNEDEIMILDVSWEDNSEKNVKKQNVGMLEVNVEQNGVVQMHQIYSNKNHIQIIETAPETKRFKCSSCTEHFPTYSELKEHLINVHKEVPDAAFCEICCKSFTCTNSLKRHMAVHTGFKPYKCKVCDRKFSQGSILKRHILTHESLKPFNCHLCKKSYTQKINLLSHLKNHGYQTGTESFHCKLCSKSFVHQSGLSRHIKLHKGVRFLCVHCKKSFSDASAVARHVKAIHQQVT